MRSGHCADRKGRPRNPSGLSAGHDYKRTRQAELSHAIDSMNIVHIKLQNLAAEVRRRQQPSEETSAQQQTGFSKRVHNESHIRITALKEEVRTIKAIVSSRLQEQD